MDISKAFQFTVSRFKWHFVLPHTSAIQRPSLQRSIQHAVNHRTSSNSLNIFVKQTISFASAETSHDLEALCCLIQYGIWARHVHKRNKERRMFQCNCGKREQKRSTLSRICLRSQTGHLCRQKQNGSIYGDFINAARHQFLDDTRHKRITRWNSNTSPQERNFFWRSVSRLALILPAAQERQRAWRCMQACGRQTFNCLMGHLLWQCHSMTFKLDWVYAFWHALSEFPIHNVHVTRALGITAIWLKKWNLRNGQEQGECKTGMLQNGTACLHSNVLSDVHAYMM